MSKEKPITVVDVIETALEERKTKTDRRQQIDSNHPYRDPKCDRRSGKDRRDE